MQCTLHIKICLPGSKFQFDNRVIWAGLAAATAVTRAAATPGSPARRRPTTTETPDPPPPSWTSGMRSSNNLSKILMKMTFECSSPQLYFSRCLSFWSRRRRFRLGAADCHAATEGATHDRCEYTLIMVYNGHLITAILGDSRLFEIF